MEEKKVNYKELLQKSKGRPCKALWKLETHNNTIKFVTCRTCGTILQENHIPRCLLNEKRDAK